MDEPWVGRSTGAAPTALPARPPTGGQVGTGPSAAAPGWVYPLAVLGPVAVGAGAIAATAALLPDQPSDCGGLDFGCGFAEAAAPLVSLAIGVVFVAAGAIVVALGLLAPEPLRAERVLRRLAGFTALAVLAAALFVAWSY